MKKILALMLALTFAAVSFFALGLTAFAVNDGANADAGANAGENAGANAGENAGADNEANSPNPDDPENTEAPTQAPTQEPATQAPTQEPATQAPTQEPATQAPSTEEPAVSGTNNINDPNENNTSASSVAPDDEIPNTGSGIVVPALALLALAGGAAIAVKAKKD